MCDQPRFLPAAAFSLDALADIFTKSFEGYFYQASITAEMLARRVRVEQLDLFRSLVMLVNDAPVGQALLGIRGEHAWCGGFGVLAPFRGQNLASLLAAAMIDSARQAGARRFSLEVLTRNERAIRTYTRAGLRSRRDLRILEWRRPEQVPQSAHEHPPARADWQLDDVADSTALLEHFAALHPVRAAWQRDLPALLTRAHTGGLAIVEAGATAGYVLFQLGTDGTARIEDVGAKRAEHVAALLAALQTRSARIVSVNEPDDSPLTPAFERCGFVESDRQHELWMELS